jgi:predicted NBD/HSP70 family sugar kinase
MSRSAVVVSSGLSKPTVNEVVEGLLADGLIIESLDDSEQLPRRPGPKARLLRFNARRGLVVGVDIGAAKLLALLADLDGNIVATVRHPTPDKGAKQVLVGIGEVVDEVVARAGVSREAVEVVVVGTPGVVDPSTGVVRFTPQFPDLHGQPLRDLLSRSLETPVLVQSEAHLAVAGEHWRGAAAELRNVVYVQIGVGVGMGILINGEVYHGAAGASGEVGYLPVGGPPSDAVEDYGPFETAVGAGAFSRLAAEVISRGKGERILAAADGGEPGPEAVLRALEAGDRAARAIVNRILETLGQGLTSVTAILNPEMVVLGGGLARPLEAYLPRLEQTLASAVPAPPRLQVTALGDRAVAMGALRLGIEHVEAQLFAALGSSAATG